MDTTTDLGAARNKVPAQQHSGFDLLLYRQVVWWALQEAQIDCERVNEHVV